MLAAIRPSSIDFPLFIHVLGAMLLVGGLVVATTAVLVARGEAKLLRVGYFTLLAVCLPAYILMRVGAEWTYMREHLDDLKSDPTWVGIGYITADIGALLLLIALVLGGFGVRRLPEKQGLVRASLYISVVLLAAYIVTVWAMSGKPS
jgi:hypothetical protein